MSATICINRWFAPLFSSLLPSRASHPAGFPGRLGVDLAASRHRCRGWGSRRSSAAAASPRLPNAPSNPPAQKVLDDLPAMDSDDEMVALLPRRNPSGLKNSHFATRQEACRKDVERAFGVLQAQFAIVRYPALSWSHDQMWEVMQACVIMHNMIIEDDRKNHVRSHVGPYECQGPLAEVDHELPDFADFLAMHAEIRDSNVHEQLQADLVEHLWRIKGNTVAP
ncbi:hypothetical protein QYE76_065017 [Lolium multiflorum]|uniref:Nuclease HARBI1 n=1 Tax=Lolium multiflorum TaxID=4521 RepID=A0AAD8S829_LOLMU|nr:hypothetical protein QYE76_065017 [Lolium multiflorum]